MAGHLEYLEHDGGEFFKDNKKLNRAKAKVDKITKEEKEKAKELSLAEKQRQWLSPENPVIWDDYE